MINKENLAKKASLTKSQKAKSAILTGVASAAILANDLVLAAPITQEQADGAASDTFANLAIVGLISLTVSYVVMSWKKSKSLAN